MSNDNTSILQSLARIEGKLESQAEANEDFKKKFIRFEARIESLEASVNQAKGGWVAIVAIPAIITAIVNFLLK